MESCHRAGDSFVIHIIRERATKEQIQEMLEEHRSSNYIKTAVDVEREILAGGGNMHADCEKVLLEDGSEQQNIWGADWYVDTKEMAFDSIINIRPKHGNRNIEIQDLGLRNKIEAITKRLIGE
jgi:hypothetical protein